MIAVQRTIGQGLILGDRFELRVVGWSESTVRLAISSALNGIEDKDMLALARSEGQSIIIDGTIEVKVVKWSRSSVRLAIQAPREVTVDRDEIWRKEHPGQMTPLEKAEEERKQRFAREGATIFAPEAGTFYAAAGPGGAPFVSIGSVVEPQTIVGAFKTAEGMIDLHAGVHGTIAKILVTSGQPVTPGQALFSVRPPAPPTATGSSAPPNPGAGTEK